MAQLSDWLGVFATVMVFVLLLWNKWDIFLLSERISVLEKVCKDSEDSDREP